MALAVTITYTFTDGKGHTSSTRVRVPTTFSLAQIAEFVPAMAQLIADLSQGELSAASAQFTVDLSGLGLKVAANALADVAEKAWFKFTSAVTGLKKMLRIPTYDETYTGAGSDAVDTADPDIAAFTAAMTNGIAVSGPATIQPTDSRGNDLVSTAEAREVKRETL